MSVLFAVERLYDSGWQPASEDVMTLDDGRPCPTLESVRAEFQADGLKLTIKHNALFNCFHASWSSEDSGELLGTVIGSEELEAAVYALAQSRSQSRRLEPAT